MILLLEARKVGVRWFGHFVASPFQEYRRVGLGIDVDVVEITVDVGQCHQALVHESEPEPWEVSEHIHAKVTIRQPWQVIEMS